MYKIYKITSNHVVDFAAEELKKYLRMMMPRAGEIDIEYKPDAKEGFRLGIMADFGLDTSEAEDITLDDIIHIDTDECGGIIAGSNPRSVLLAVYRYLTINGCRWLFPGTEGEYIPIKNIESTKYHKMADCRYRGQCNEGGEPQQIMMDAIDFTPKVGMNIFMLEFDIPKAYYDNYYLHRGNERHFEPEPVPSEVILQWKRQCEAEMAKRGLQFHDMGHGWTAEPFGFDTTDGWAKADSSKIPPEKKEFLAQMDGERKFHHDIPLNTNFCMSNPKARKTVVDYIVNYASLATNVDYLHVWLADGYNNHCECDECKKMIPSDYYLMMMNELDEELTKRNLDTRIVFICYFDTAWAPTKVKLNNPKRFSLLVAAITRNYTIPVDKNLDTSTLKLTEYNRNNNDFPKNVNEYIAHAQNWARHCNVHTFVYEYHFWVKSYQDVGTLDFAEVLYKDIIGYKANGCNGIVEDGSQRSFFPNGFNFFVYGNTLFDNSVKFEDLLEDYFSHAYGEDYKKVIEFFRAIGKKLDFAYIAGNMSSDMTIGKWYNPDMIPKLRECKQILADFIPFVKEHRVNHYRPQTVAYKLLLRYIELCQALCDVYMLKSAGMGVEAREKYQDFMYEFGKYEPEMLPFYDQWMVLNGYLPSLSHFDPSRPYG
jgi:hypothetical protein